MAKITHLASTPDAWLPSLEHRTVFYDPVHGEMIGAESEITITENIRGVPVADDVGAYTEAEIIGDDDEDEDEGALEEDSSGTPEDAGAPPPDEVVQMGPDDDEAGPSEAPTFSSVTGPATRMLPSLKVRPFGRPPGVPPRAVLARKAIASFRAKIVARDPRAIQALTNLRKRAVASPVHATVYKAVMTPAKAGFSIHGEPIGSTVGSAAAAIIKLSLSPVVWATRGVGSVSQEIGKQLQNLSRKL